LSHRFSDLSLLSLLSQEPFVFGPQKKDAKK